MGMNIETMAQKAATGELPNELRVALLKGMASVAKEQRSGADAIKPEPPPVTGAKRVAKVLSGGTGAGKVGGSKGSVSLAKARTLPQFAGKSDAEITSAAKALGYEVRP